MNIYDAGCSVQAAGYNNDYLFINRQNDYYASDLNPLNIQNVITYGGCSISQPSSSEKIYLIPGSYHIQYRTCAMYSDSRRYRQLRTEIRLNDELYTGVARTTAFSRMPAELCGNAIIQVPLGRKYYFDLINDSGIGVHFSDLALTVVRL